MYRHSSAPIGDWAMLPPVSVAQNMPAEILLSIFGWLRSDPWTLRALLHTCRAWSGPAQATKFHTVTIRSLKSLSSFCELLRRPQTACIGHAVRVLCIHPMPKDPTPNPWIDQVPRVLAQHLPGVRTLQFQGIQGWNASIKEFPAFVRGLGAFESVQELAFNNCMFGDLHEMNDVVTAFRLRILTLVLKHVTTKRADDSVQPLRALIELKNLQMGGPLCHMKTLIGWLQSNSSWNSLENVELSHVEVKYLSDIGRLLAAAGGSLKTLRLGLVHDATLIIPGQPTLGDYIGFGLNHRLTHLHFTISELLSTTMSWIDWILSEIGSGTAKIKRVTFDISPFSARQIYEGTHFDAISDFLEQRLRLRYPPALLADQGVPRSVEKVVFLVTVCPESGGINLGKAATFLHARFGYLDEIAGRQVLFVKDATDFSG